MRRKKTDGTERKQATQGKYWQDSKQGEGDTRTKTPRANVQSNPLAHQGQGGNESSDTKERKNAILYKN